METGLECYLREMPAWKRARLASGCRKVIRHEWPNRSHPLARVRIETNLAMLRNLRAVV